MGDVSVRYIVDDVQTAVDFYTAHLGFTVEMRPDPRFAMLSKGDLRLLLNEPTGPGGAAQPTPDGRRPEPGGWNRFQLSVADLAHRVEVLRASGARIRSDIIVGRGGTQVVVEDPSGNPIELFEPPPGRD